MGENSHVGTLRSPVGPYFHLVDKWKQVVVAYGFDGWFVRDDDICLLRLVLVVIVLVVLDVLVLGLRCGGYQTGSGPHQRVVVLRTEGVATYRTGSRQGLPSLLDGSADVGDGRSGW